MPNKRVIALTFTRYGDSADDDFSKQKEEYIEMHGSAEHVTFFVISDYASIDGETYPEFIDRKRRECSSKSQNCFIWWPDLPALEAEIN